MPFESLTFKDYLITSYLTSWLRALTLRSLEIAEYDLTFWQSQTTNLVAGVTAFGMYTTSQSVLAKWRGSKEMEKRRVDVEGNKPTQDEKLENVRLDKN